MLSFSHHVLCIQHQVLPREILQWLMKYSSDLAEWKKNRLSKSNNCEFWFAILLLVNEMQQITNTCNICFSGEHYMFYNMTFFWGSGHQNYVSWSKLYLMTDVGLLFLWFQTDIYHCTMLFCHGVADSLMDMTTVHQLN